MGSNPRQVFKKKILAVSVAALASVSYSAIAQDAAPVEEVIVTGMRASLENAMDIKRDSTGVVDAISAEDIGKMPDQNLAESLQRITGLSISRSNGEGSQVTARGIDARFNMVTLNGRNMPAVANGGSGDDATRAFDFSNIAAEGVNGVEVYKTGRADVTSGGLGATINVKTLKPLDAGDTKFIAGVKAVHDETVVNGSEVTPELSGLFNWVNEDDNFGISVIGAYQERDSSRSNAFVNQWQLREWGKEADRNAPAVPVSAYKNADGSVKTGANVPAVGQLYSVPTDLRYALEDNERVRTNGQVTMQYRPVENITATVDYTYSENKLYADRAQQSTWFGVANITNIQFDNNVVKTPLLYEETYPDSFKDVAFAQQEFTSATQNDSLGFNLAFEPSDNTKFSVDYHDSTAYNLGEQAEAGMAAQVAGMERTLFDRDLPVMGVVVADNATKADKVNLDGSLYRSGNGNGIIDAGDIGTTIGTFRRGMQRTDIKQLQLDGAIEFDSFAFFDESGVDFGVDMRKDTNNTKVAQNRITMGNWGGVDPARFNDNIFTARDFGAGFGDYSESTSHPWFLHDGVDANTAELFEVVEWMNANPSIRDTGNFNGFPNGKAQWDRQYQTNRTIEEDVLSVYASFDGRFELGGMEAGVAVGLKYEETDVLSTSDVVPPASLVWESDDDWRLDSGKVRVPYSVSGDYDNLLPNIDLDLSPIEDLKLRASYSTTIARAEYGRLSSNATITQPYLRRTASAGNPKLLPMESNNFDFSAEWYYTDDSYVSAGFFRKDVSNFIGNGTEIQNHYGLTDPLLSDLYRRTVTDARIDQNTERAFLAFAAARGYANPTQGTVDIPSLGSDPLAQFNTTLPSNNKDAVIDGLELAAQHWFGDSGFGVQANVTLVDSDVGFDNSLGFEIEDGNKVEAKQFAMIGLSDTANLIGFYENYGWEVRIAYNWRDEYINNTAFGGNNEPSYTEAFSQIDFSVGYELNENVSFTVEGLNITGENSRTHGRSEVQMQSLEDLGARYAAGVRYSF